MFRFRHSTGSRVLGIYGLKTTVFCTDQPEAQMKKYKTVNLPHIKSSIIGNDPNFNYSYSGFYSGTIAALRSLLTLKSIVHPIQSNPVQSSPIQSNPEPCTTNGTNGTNIATGANTTTVVCRSNRKLKYLKYIMLLSCVSNVVSGDNLATVTGDYSDTVTEGSEYPTNTSFLEFQNYPYLDLTNGDDENSRYRQVLNQLEMFGRFRDMDHWNKYARDEMYRDQQGNAPDNPAHPMNREYKKLRVQAARKIAARNQRAVKGSFLEGEDVSEEDNRKSKVKIERIHI